MNKTIQKSIKRQTLAALVIASLLPLLCACSKTAGTIKPVYQSIPEKLLIPTPAPAVPDENTVTDNALGVFMQNQDKALEQCNADKGDIAKLVNKKI